MQEDIQKVLNRMCDPKEEEAYHFADKLGGMADEETKDHLITLVKGDQWEIAYLISFYQSNRRSMGNSLFGLSCLIQNFLE